MTDVTDRLVWFLACFGRAIHGADEVPGAVTAKAVFWERAAAPPLNQRQIKVLNRLLDEFEGKMRAGSRRMQTEQCPRNDPACQPFTEKDVSDAKPSPYPLPSDRARVGWELRPGSETAAPDLGGWFNALDQITGLRHHPQKRHSN